MGRETSAKVPYTDEQRHPEPNGHSRRSPGGWGSRRKGTDRLEVEWRFDAPDLAVVEGWLAGRSGALETPGVSVAAEGETKALSDTYHDTEDWRFYRAGYALRVREGEKGGAEATLKSLTAESGDAGEARRREVTETLKGDGAAVESLRGSRGPAGELFRAFAGAREVRSVFALRTRCRTFDLVLRDAPENGGGIVADASGDIREADEGDGGGDRVEGEASTDAPANGAGVVIDASGDVRERESGEAEETDTRSEDGVEDETEEIVVDAAGDIREREPWDEPSDEPSDGVAGGAGGRVVGEVALDETEILLGDGEEPVRLSRVEVEVGTGDVDSAPELLGGFVGEMREALGLKPTRLSKYAAGLFATGQSPEAAADLGPTGIDASLTLGELAFAVLRRQFAKMRSHEPGVRIGEDPEEVHDMRVATRRMRAAIKLFKGALPERARHLRGELKWLANVLGDVRDLDVQLERLEGWVAGTSDEPSEDEEYREALRRAARAMERRREEARGPMLEALDSARYERFETSFAEMLKLGPRGGLVPGGPPDGDSTADEPAVVAGSGLLSRRYRKWRKLARGLDGSSVPEDYHELRKEGKRLRYALEFFADVYGESATDGLVKPLKAVQDDLGLHQDDIVAAEWLRELATGGHRFPSKAAFFVGMLAGDLLREAAEIRSGLRENEAFGAVAGGKEWKAFEKTISKAGDKADAKAGPKKKAYKKKK